MDGDSAIFEDMFLHLIHIVICSAKLWMTEVFSYFNRGLATYYLGGKKKIGVLSTVCSPRAASDIQMVSVAYLPILSKT
jgi:hypothetical protein